MYFSFALVTLRVTYSRDVTLEEDTSQGREDVSWPTMWNACGHVALAHAFALKKEDTKPSRLRKHVHFWNRNALHVEDAVRA